MKPRLSTITIFYQSTHHVHLYGNGKKGTGVYDWLSFANLRHIRAPYFIGDCATLTALHTKTVQQHNTQCTV